VEKHVAYRAENGALYRGPNGMPAVSVCGDRTTPCSRTEADATLARGEMVPMLYNWDAIRSSATSHQVLDRP
jgi:hypothetical protein